MRDQSSSHEPPEPIEILEHVSRQNRTDARGPLIEDVQLLLGVIDEWKNSGVRLMTALGGVMEGDGAESREVARGICAALRVHFRELEEILYWSQQLEGFHDSVAPVEPAAVDLSEIVIHLGDK